MNDLAKVLNINFDTKSKIVKRILSYSIDEIENILTDRQLLKLSKDNNFLEHFSKLFDTVRYFGRHASGVVVCNKDVQKYTGLMRLRDTLVTSFDLNDLETLGTFKLDILGLDMLSVIDTIEDKVNIEFEDNYLKSKSIYQAFINGETEGIFQFESKNAKDILKVVKPENIQELIACNALNRPAPLKLGMVDAYVDAKNTGILDTKPWSKYLVDTYGTVLYQEHIMLICRELAKMNWPDIDKLIKAVDLDRLSKIFVNNISKYTTINKKEALEFYNQIVLYLFNKAHSTAYTLLSAYSMYLAIHYPLEYYCELLKREANGRKRRSYESVIASKNHVVLLAHINGSAKYSIVKFKGERTIQQGLEVIKGVGSGTAKVIERNKPYRNLDELKASIDKRSLRSNVLEALEQYGALKFDNQKYIEGVISYNAVLVDEYNRRNFW